MKRAVHIRRNPPEDDYPYCGGFLLSHWEKWLAWRWVYQFEKNPQQITCQACVDGYDREQLELLAGTELGDE
jgi:hypothetical protein